MVDRPGRFFNTCRRVIASGKCGAANRLDDRAKTCQVCVGSDRVRKLVKWWLPVLVWMGIIFVGSSIGDVPRVGGRTTDGFVHRAAHVIEFAVLGALLLRALSKERPVSRREVIITLILVALYGVSDELHQRFTPGRSSEGVSVVFDVAGGLIGALGWRWWVSTATQRINEAVDQRVNE
jgi:VanZ family protein